VVAGVLLVLLGVLAGSAAYRESVAIDELAPARRPISDESKTP